MNGVFSGSPQTLLQAAALKVFASGRGLAGAAKACEDGS
jgi:hypothetical protein